MLLNRWMNRIRQNHALEHATINLLSQRYAGAHVMGVSGPLGFVLYSTLTVEEIIPAVREALKALKAGQTALAVHENCGTNLVITAAMTTLATLLGFGYVPDVWPSDNRERRRSGLVLLERLPQVVLMNAVALLLAAPLARWTQEHVTTSGDLADVEIDSFFTDRQGAMSRVRVHTRSIASVSEACMSEVTA